MSTETTITTTDPTTGETVTGTIAPRTGSIWGHTFHADVCGDGTEVWAIPCDLDGHTITTPADWQSDCDWEDSGGMRLTLQVAA